MPISPENKKRYPKDWDLRSRFVRKIRANNKCEWCGVDNYAIGYRDDDGKFIGVSGGGYLDMAAIGKDDQGIPLSYKDARDLALFFTSEGYDKYIVIVLTTAHVYDMRPEAAGLLNLASLCQRCHNVHDMPMRQASRKKNIEINQLELL